MSDKDKIQPPVRDDGSNVGVVVKNEAKTRKPSMYKVVMLNDDYTPMEFVVMVLEKVFNKKSHLFQMGSDLVMTCLNLLLLTILLCLSLQNLLQ